MFAIPHSTFFFAVKFGTSEPACFVLDFCQALPIYAGHTPRALWQRRCRDETLNVHKTSTFSRWLFDHFPWVETNNSEIFQSAGPWSGVSFLEQLAITVYLTWFDHIGPLNWSLRLPNMKAAIDGEKLNWLKSVMFLGIRNCHSFQEHLTPFESVARGPFLWQLDKRCQHVQRSKWSLIFRMLSFHHVLSQALHMQPLFVALWGQGTPFYSFFFHAHKHTGCQKKHSNTSALFCPYFKWSYWCKPHKPRTEGIGYTILYIKIEVIIKIQFSSVYIHHLQQPWHYHGSVLSSLWFAPRGPGTPPCQGGQGDSSHAGADGRSPGGQSHSCRGAGVMPCLSACEPGKLKDKKSHIYTNIFLYIFIYFTRIYIFIYIYIYINYIYDTCICFWVSCIYLFCICLSIEMCDIVFGSCFVNPWSIDDDYFAGLKTFNVHIHSMDIHPPPRDVPLSTLLCWEDLHREPAKDVAERRGDFIRVRVLAQSVRT